jgi:hypothetical protein
MFGGQLVLKVLCVKYMCFACLFCVQTSLAVEWHEPVPGVAGDHLPS